MFLGFCALNPMTAIGLVFASKEMKKAASSRLTAQREVERQRYWLEAIMHQMPVGMVVLVNEGRDVAMANAAFYEIFQINHTAAITAEWRECIKAFDRDGKPYPMDQLPGAKALAARRAILDEEIMFQRPNGQTLWLQVSAAPIFEYSGEVNVVVTYGDITNRKTAQQQQKLLLRDTLKAQEDERLRIARELHDELGQDLTALSIGLKNLGYAAGPFLNEKIDDLRKDVRLMNDHVRSLTASLRPLVINDIGLHHALDDLAMDWANRLGIRIVTDLDALDLDIAQPVAIVLYRVVQEAITNVAKHARASRLELIAHTGDGVLTLKIADNGVGFNVLRRENPLNHCFGLASMSERLSMIGGKLHIDSVPGEGTEIKASLMLERISDDGHGADV